MSSINTNSQQELIARIKELETEVKQLKSRKKYGLVWEDKPEDVVLQCERQIPVLKEIKNRKIVTSENSPTNLLIEGDNYHALSVLNYTHKGKIDVIYIDPPYNTGNKDFIYNDNYVDKEDSFRHSKWLSFMENRLKLAKELLKDSGVIFISIDDNEQAQLKLLCDSVFGEGNFINCLVWQYDNSTMKNTSGRLATKHEYILIYSKSFNYQNKWVKLRHGEVSKELLKRFGKYADENNNIFLRDVIHEKSYLERILPRFKNIHGRDADQDDVIDSLEPNYLRSTVNIPTQRSNDFFNKFNLEFNNPKPVELIKLLVKLIKYEAQFTVLDFMAGSGTTGHAVMKLNKEDGGNRQFILCTNNENNICEEVTYERLKRVIKGYENKKGDKVEGLGGNLEYLKCDFIDKTRHTDNMKMRLMRACSEMLCLKENTFEVIKEVKDGETLMYRLYKGIKINEDGNNKEHIVGIYYDLDDSYLDDMRSDLKNYESSYKTAYIFSLRNVSDFIDDYRKWKGIQIEEVPQKILEIYESIYKRNNRT